MSATDSSTLARPEQETTDLYSEPTVALDWDVDDPVDPSTLTIFADRTETTVWLSADFENAISLADAR